MASDLTCNSCPLLMKVQDEEVKADRNLGASIFIEGNLSLLICYKLTCIKYYYLHSPNVSHFK